MSYPPLELANPADQPAIVGGLKLDLDLELDLIGGPAYFRLLFACQVLDECRWSGGGGGALVVDDECRFRDGGCGCGTRCARCAC
jgi:hypothetical protein